MSEMVHSVYSGTSTMMVYAAGIGSGTLLLPRLTLDGWLSLPEIESSECQSCDGLGFERYGVWTCPRGHQWRWPGTMGLD